MKKILFFAILAIIAIFAMATSVLATGSVPETEVVENIAQIGEKGFATLQDAIDSVATDATEATTIILLKDVEDGAGFVTKKGQNIVIDFNEHTYKITDFDKLVGSTGTKTLGCQLNKGSKVTLKNGTFESDVAKMLVQNYSDLTVMDMTLDKKSTEGSYALSNNCGEVYVGGETNIYSNKIAFDVCWATNAGYKEGTQVTIETTGEIVGDIEIAKWNEETTSEGANEKNTLLIKDILHTGNIVPSEENFKEQVTIQGGEFDSDVLEYVDETNGYLGRLTDTVNGKNYLVGKEYSITVKDVEGAELAVNKTKALKGEVVTFEGKAEFGYTFDGLSVVDINGGRGEFVPNGKLFEMPEYDALVKASVTKLSQEVDTQDNVVTDEKVEEILTETLKEYVTEDPELLKDLEGKEIVVKVELEEKKVEEEEAKAMETAAAKEVKDIKVSKYIDITIAVKDSKTGETLTELPELKEALTFTVEVPEDLPEVSEGFKRVFYIVRNHEGEVKLLDTKLSKDGKSLEFESNVFSTYAIAYVDIKEEVKDNSNNPATGDNILVYVTALAVSVVGIATIAIVRKRNRVSK